MPTKCSKNFTQNTPLISLNFQHWNLSIISMFYTLYNTEYNILQYKFCHLFIVRTDDKKGVYEEIYIYVFFG